MTPLLNWNQVTAIYGGAFDPPHLSHFKVVEGLLKVPGLGRVIVMPAGALVNKKALTAAHHRFQMCKLLLGSIAEISDLEIQRAQLTAQPSFTYDTLIQMRAKFPHLAFVLGSDQLVKLPEWRCFPDLLKLCHWIVLARAPHGEKACQQGTSALEGSGLIRKEQNPRSTFPTWTVSGSPYCMTIVPTPASALSSQSIREELGRSGNCPPGTLSPILESYLKQHRLYGT